MWRGSPLSPPNPRPLWVRSSTRRKAALPALAHSERFPPNSAFFTERPSIQLLAVENLWSSPSRMSMFCLMDFICRSIFQAISSSEARLE
mmetsp:Transcript_64456/g.112555  ORF Transcript_64456/g.112555 Transcript_64456/m.112555 type:complete len:90 (-) Transcript_64456:780-1049(-)